MKALIKKDNGTFKKIEVPNPAPKHINIVEVYDRLSMDPNDPRICELPNSENYFPVGTAICDGVELYVYEKRPYGVL